MAESNLSISESAGVHVARFRHRSILDAPTIDRIATELYGLVEVDEARKIVLDFQEVAFLSSQALGILIALRKKAEERKALVAITRIRPELQQVFKITGLTKLFRFFDTLQEALDFFHESSMKTVVSGIRRKTLRR
ncbi:MAG: STAS domain-containing protein [Planctomycetes bacterium]|nr:STAS domain-containing protein [Planctomycetota bacterium]